MDEKNRYELEDSLDENPEIVFRDGHLCLIFTLPPKRGSAKKSREARITAAEKKIAKLTSDRETIVTMIKQRIECWKVALDYSKSEIEDSLALAVKLAPLKSKSAKNCRLLPEEADKLIDELTEKLKTQSKTLANLRKSIQE